MGDSVYFGGKAPALAHLVRGEGGLAGEIKDLRADMDESFQDMEGGGLTRLDTWTDPPVADPDYFLAARTTAVTAEKLSSADLLASTIPTGPRGILITRSAQVGAYTTADITIKGKAYGESITLTFTPADADGGDTVGSNEDWGLDEIIEVLIPAQALATGAFDIGFTADMVLRRGIKAMAGITTPLREVEAGVVVTSGGFTGRKYLPPINVPNGTRDYAVLYVMDPTV